MDILLILIILFSFTTIFFGVVTLILLKALVELDTKYSVLLDENYTLRDRLIEAQARSYIK